MVCIRGMKSQPSNTRASSTHKKIHFILRLQLHPQQEIKSFPPLNSSSIQYWRYEFPFFYAREIVSKTPRVASPRQEVAFLQSPQPSLSSWYCSLRFWSSKADTWEVPSLLHQTNTSNRWGGMQSYSYFTDVSKNVQSSSSS